MAVDKDVNGTSGSDLLSRGIYLSTPSRAVEEEEGVRPWCLAAAAAAAADAAATACLLLPARVLS